MSAMNIAQNCYTTPLEGKLESLTQLKTWLLDPDHETLTRASASGAVGEIIPEWKRLTGPRNIQHSTHHFPLDVHTLAVVEGTRHARGFDTLTEYEQFITLLAALLHDIDKTTGPRRLQGFMAVDKLHPIRSAEVSKTILTRLGCSWSTIQRVYTLIHHHQVFGRLFIFFPEGAPMEATDKIALKTRSFSLLKSLVAINEGDIRGVKCEDALFTADVAEELPRYSQRVDERIARYAAKTPLLPQQLGYAVSEHTHTLDHFAGFVLPAQSEAELTEKLAIWSWGGALALPYTSGYHPELWGPYTALIHVLPENLGYWGPELPGMRPGHHLSMQLFFALRQNPLLETSQLSSLEQHLLKEGDLAQSKVQVHLAQLAQALEMPDWTTMYRQIERQTFGAPMASHPWDVHCLQAMSHHYPEQTLWGIVTRPLLVGLVSPTPVPHLSAAPGILNFIGG